ncbi:MAG: hypothetical protein FWD88_05225 [Treponema sp.]|nr:hypothetical protein [Treponema sp.]
MNRIRLLVPIFLLAAFLLVPGGLLSQDANNGAVPQAGANGDDDESALPRQFRELALGMDMDALQDALQRDGLFNFRGERDVSFVPIREESLIETSGSSFIQRAFFQLRDGELFIMSFTLSTELMDHHSMFTHFVRRFGQPTYLNPRESIWEDEDTRISLGRPLTVRYIDRRVFNDIVSESTLVESRRVHERQEFLDEF